MSWQGSDLGLLFCDNEYYKVLKNKRVLQRRNEILIDVQPREPVGPKKSSNS
jgi:hypothetical protein